MSEKAKSFAVVLASLDGGAFNDKLSRDVQNLIADMSNHAQISGGNAKGKVAINLDLKMEKGIISITSDSKITAPKEAKSTSIFWADKDNNLTEENPKQRRFEFDDGNVAGIRSGSVPTTA